MAVGFEVYGSHGGLQISDTTPAMVIRQTGSIQTPGTRNSVQFTLPCEMGCPVLAIRPEGVDGVAVYCENRNAGSVTYRAVSEVATSFRYYLFDRCQNVDNGAALIVFGPDSSVVFSSDQPPMRIVAMSRIPDGNLRTGFSAGSVYGGEPNRTYACALLNPRRYFFEPNGPPKVRHVEGLRTDGPQGFVTTSQTTNGPGDVGSSNTGGYLMMVDVTGF